MYVNSVNNTGYAFRANEAGEAAPKEVKAPVADNAGSSQAVDVQPKKDEFEKQPKDEQQTQQSVTKQAEPEKNGAMNFVAQLNKLQTTQKVIGGTLLGVGVLGALSFLSPKKWVRALFAIPAGGVLAFFGVNMLHSAKTLDKIKEITTAQQGQ